MKEKYIVYAAVFISIIAVTAAFMHRIVQKRVKINGDNTKKPKSLMVLSIVCCICLVIQGFLVNEIYNSVSDIFKSQIKPISFDLFEKIDINNYPEMVSESNFYIETDEKGNFSVPDNRFIIPGYRTNRFVSVDNTKIDNFSIDFNDNTSVIVIDGREYVFVNKKVSHHTYKIGPTVWADNENKVSKLYVAVPISGFEELMVYTDISKLKNAEEIEILSSYLQDLTSQIKIANTVTLKINGYNRVLKEIGHITRISVTFKDDSFLSASFVDEKQHNNLKTLYSEAVFEKWQLAQKIPQDSIGKRVYVRVVDDIRYNLFTEEEVFDLVSQVICFDKTIEDKCENFIE